MYFDYLEPFEESHDSNDAGKEARTIRSRQFYQWYQGIVLTVLVMFHHRETSVIQYKIRLGDSGNGKNMLYLW